jgi:hypothetical protein
MYGLIYLPLEENLVTDQESSPKAEDCLVQPPLDPTHKDFDFSLWSKAVKERMNQVLQKKAV